MSKLRLRFFRRSAFFVIGIGWMLWGWSAPFLAAGKVPESWMGVYMNGVKVGYMHSLESREEKNGIPVIKNISESVMTLSRLGSNPIEIKTVQESWFDQSKKPLETVLKTIMSESITEIKAEIRPDRVLFSLAGEIVKELPYDQEFFLGVPLEDIVMSERFKPGYQQSFKILDPIAYAFSECRFEVIGEEQVLILGRKKQLWHVRSELFSVIPIVVDEWIDERGEVHRSDTKTGFMETVSIRMSQAKAMEPGEKNFDIAFSSIIRSNKRLSDPQSIKSLELKLSGLSLEQLRRFPWEKGVQEILEEQKDSIRIRTTSRIMQTANAPELPITDPLLSDSLAATAFIQSDNAEIIRTAREIIGSERNSWIAAKQIAEWIGRELTPNYDVGFAPALEILHDRKGDCTEHSVLMVALCRAVGIPARAAVGIMYVDGFFAYHMWPEVYVGQWIGLDAIWLAKDNHSGEYYTDATHIKFGLSNLDENMFAEMITSISEIIGKLRLEIIDPK